MEGNHFIRCIEKKRQEVNYVELLFQVEFNFSGEMFQSML